MVKPIYVYTYYVWTFDNIKKNSLSRIEELYIQQRIKFVLVTCCEEFSLQFQVVCDVVCNVIFVYVDSVWRRLNGRERRAWVIDGADVRSRG